MQYNNLHRIHIRKSEKHPMLYTNLQAITQNEFSKLLHEEQNLDFAVQMDFAYVK